MVEYVFTRSAIRIHAADFRNALVQRMIIETDTTITVAQTVTCDAVRVFIGITCVILMRVVKVRFALVTMLRVFVRHAMLDFFLGFDTNSQGIVEGVLAVMAFVKEANRAKLVGPRPAGNSPRFQRGKIRKLVR